MPRPTSLLLPISALVIAMVSIQVGASFAKTLFPVLGPEGTTALRLSFGALMLIIVLRPWRAVGIKQNWRVLALYGVNLGIMNLFYYMAVERIPLGIATAIEFLGPLAVAVCASRRRTDFVWVTFAAMGILLLLPFKAGAASLDPIGIFYALLAALGWAFYIIIGKKAGDAIGGSAPALGMLIGAIVVLPVGIFEAGPALLAWSIIPLALVVAGLSSAIPFAFEMVALRRLKPQAYGTLTSMEPAIGAFSGLIILHEALSPTQWLAISLIICASIGTTLTTERKPALAE